LLGGNQPEARVKQIEAISRSLKLDESLQKTWIEVAARNKTSNGGPIGQDRKEPYLR